MEMISAISYNVRVSPAGESALANAPINTTVMVIGKRKKKKKNPIKIKQQIHYVKAGLRRR